MNKDFKGSKDEQDIKNEEELMCRRGFLLGLRKWSMVVIGGALAGGAVLSSAKEANSGAWANRAGGGGAWANRGGAWANRGGSWVNGGGAWANRGAAWANRGAAWVNRF